jgi:hypothetical protein
MAIAAHSRARTTPSSRRCPLRAGDPVEGRSLKAFTEHLLKHAATPVKLAKSVADLEKEEQESDARNAEFMKTNAAAAGDDEDYDEEDLETDSDGPQGDDEESVKSEL